MDDASSFRTPRPNERSAAFAAAAAARASRHVRVRVEAVRDADEVAAPEPRGHRGRARRRVGQNVVAVPKQNLRRTTERQRAEEPREDGEKPKRRRRRKKSRPPRRPRSHGPSQRGPHRGPQHRARGDGFDGIIIRPASPRRVRREVGEERRRGDDRWAPQRRELPRVGRQRVREPNARHRRGGGGRGRWCLGGFGVERAEGFEDVGEGSPEPRGVEERGGAREEIRADGVGERARLGVAEDDHGARGLRRGEAGEEVRAVPRRGGEGVRERGEVVVVAGGIAAAAAAGGGSRSRGRRRRGVQRGVDERVEALLVELEDDRVGADALDDRADLLRGRAPGRVHRADDVELAAAAARVHARHRRDARREVERRGVVRGGGGDGDEDAGTTRRRAGAGAARRRDAAAGGRARQSARAVITRRPRGWRGERRRAPADGRQPGRTCPSHT